MIVRPESLASFEPEWRDLYSRCAFQPVFLSPMWLKAWWAEFGDTDGPLILSARESGRLVAAVPMMRRGDTITFAGDSSVCDYMDLTCDDGERHEVLAAMIRALSEEPWQCLRLWALREDSPTFAALPAVCDTLGLRLTAEVEDVCPQIDLPGSWDEYVSGLRKKDRHELRRKLRRLPQAGAVELEVLDSPEDISRAMDDFVRMHRASRAEKAAFMTDQMERFFRAAVLALAADRRVEMTFLRLSGRRAAAVLCFRSEGELMLYNSGYDPEYAAFSVGLLSKAIALQRAIEGGLRRFDFLRGPEPYKYDLGASDLNVYRCDIVRA